MNTFWTPFDELDALRRGIDDLFADFWPTSRARHSAFLPAHSARAYPLVNVAAEDDRYRIEAFAPGLDQDSLELTVQRNVLTIAGEKRELSEVPAEKFHRRERATGRFVRTLHLDSEIDEDRVEAHYEHGILRIDLPKSPAALPKKIDVAVK